MLLVREDFLFCALSWRLFCGVRVAPRIGALHSDWHDACPPVQSRISELTGEASLRANLALLENNARVGAEIALSLAKP